MWFFIVLTSTVLINVFVDGMSEPSISREEFDNLKATVQQQENAIMRQTEMIRDLESMFTVSMELTKKQGQVEDIARTTRHVQVPVAFFATLGVKSIDNVNVNQNIPFDDIVTNIGNGYNNGIFTAPVDGIYLITTSILSRQNMEFWVEIQKNGHTIVRLNEIGSDGRHGSASHTVILSLHTGDNVVVRNTHPHEAYWGDKYCSFGGVLIYDLESDIALG